MKRMCTTGDAAGANLFVKIHRHDHCQLSESFWKLIKKKYFDCELEGSTVYIMSVIDDNQIGRAR